MTKQPMQADGGATRPDMADENGELASRRDADQGGGLPNTGESGGGAYPNPHTGKGGSPDGPDKFGGHGGQTRIDYHGGGQLGDERPTGTPNSPTE